MWSFLRTLWQVTSPGSTGTTRRPNSNRHSGRVPRLRDQRSGARCEAKRKVMLLAFFDCEGTVHREYAPDGQTVNKEFYVEVLRRLSGSVRRKTTRENGGMATGSCTTTMRPHTLHILCGGYWPNTAPLSCSSRHTHRIAHRVNFSCSQGLTFWHRGVFFLILAHPVYKMWIIQEPNTSELWNKLHFEEKENGEYIPCLKYSVLIFVE